ncbi:MAG: helix-turn-helix domain-containing protein [Deltaproteobacteria bacterium]|nr:helix-turn-helix domain-containing protein [Deltaproteobacteria bacterium]
MVESNRENEFFAYHPLLTTKEAAELLRRAPHTLRVWAMRDTGPISPIRTRPNAPLLWRRSDIEALIKGETVH